MNFPQLTNNIQMTHEVLQCNAMRAINQNLTARNWLVGYWIVEFEQNGEDRAKYGDRLLSELAKSIRVKGLGRSMLNLCRKVYVVYPDIGREIGLFLLQQHNAQIIQTLIGLLQNVDNQSKRIIQTLSGKFQLPEILQMLSENAHKENSIIQLGNHFLPQVDGARIFNSLSFSHIIELLSFDNPLKRVFYEIESIKGCWSVRELRRQIDSLCFERAGISEHPEKLLALVNEKAEVTLPANVVKTQYVFDFLGLKCFDDVEESDLESMLISHIHRRKPS